MAVSSTVSTLSFTGNGSNVTPYALTNLRFDSSAWLTVEVIAANGTVTELDEGTGYTLSGTGSTGSASLVTVAAVANTATLRVTRDTPLVQSLDYEVNAPVFTTALERGLDWIVMALQDLARRLLGKTDTTTFDAHTVDTTNIHGIADTSALETTTGAQSKADAAEAAAIATAATDATTKANAAQAAAIQRSNHTGAQAISTVTGLQDALDAKAAASHTHTFGDLTDVITVVKPEDTGRSNTDVLADDPHLVVALTAGVWAVEIFFHTSTPAGGGHEWQVSGPTLDAARSTRTSIVTTNLTTEVTTGSVGLGAYTFNSSATGGVIAHHRLLLTVTNPGDLVVRWAQQTSSFLGLIMRAGSYIRATKLS